MGKIHNEEQHLFYCSQNIKGEPGSVGGRATGLQAIVRGIHQNSGIFRSNFVIFIKLLNNSKMYIKTWTDGLLNTLKSVHKLSTDIIKFVVAVQKRFFTSTTRSNNQHL